MGENVLDNENTQHHRKCSCPVVAFSGGETSQLFALIEYIILSPKRLASGKDGGGRPTLITKWNFQMVPFKILD